MKSSVQNLLDSARKQMGGYVALYNYRLMNLSVKAAPEALLSFTVTWDGEQKNIEDVAQACNPDGRDDQFAIYPKEKAMIVPIMQGMAKAHPEYKVEVIGPEDGDEEEQSYILATMPEVDKTRHDVLMDAVDILSDWCDGRVQASFTLFSGQIALKLVGASSDEMDEAKDALQQLHDQHTDQCKEFRAQKEQEIEEAYKAYQDEQAQKESLKQEQDAAHNLQAGLQMNMNGGDE